MHKLPTLSYNYDALEPHIDARTMEIHHTKHHQAYIDKLNAALEGQDDLAAKSIEDLLRSISEVPDDIRQAVINHGGGHANHSLFWLSMSPNGGGDPADDLLEAMNTSFGDVGAFRKEFAGVAGARFGSGWAWLVFDGDMLSVVSTANQDSPLLEGKTPLLGLDVWEHAYYLNYQNHRGDYVGAFWNVVNWQEIARRYGETR